MARKKVELDAFADLNTLRDPAEHKDEVKPVFDKNEKQKPEEKPAVEVKNEKKAIPKRREKKQRIGFAIYPSLYEKLNKIAYMKNISTSKLMDDVLRAYTDSEDAKGLISEYDSLDL